MNKNSYVYILCSKRNGTLYIGVTSDLIKRIWQHKNKVIEGFTKKYGVDKLGHYEICEDINSAIAREKHCTPNAVRSSVISIRIAMFRIHDEDFSILEKIYEEYHK